MREGLFVVLRVELKRYVSLVSVATTLVLVTRPPSTTSSSTSCSPTTQCFLGARSRYSNVFIDRAQHGHHHHRRGRRVDANVFCCRRARGGQAVERQAAATKLLVAAEMRGPEKKTKRSFNVLPRGDHLLAHDFEELEHVLTRYATAEL